jgi:hypothetical protein
VIIDHEGILQDPLPSKTPPNTAWKTELAACKTLARTSVAALWLVFGRIDCIEALPYAALRTRQHSWLNHSSCA